jgi:hypothetical protein
MLASVTDNKSWQQKGLFPLHSVWINDTIRETNPWVLPIWTKGMDLKMGPIVFGLITILRRSRLLGQKTRIFFFCFLLLLWNVTRVLKTINEKEDLEVMMRREPLIKDKKPFSPFL